MAFRELVFTVSEDLAEDLGDALMELGALSISVSDAAADTESEKKIISTIHAKFPDHAVLSEECGLIPGTAESLIQLAKSLA